MQLSGWSPRKPCSLCRTRYQQFVSALMWQRYPIIPHQPHTSEATLHMNSHIDIHRKWYVGQSPATGDSFAGRSMWALSTGILSSVSPLVYLEGRIHFRVHILEGVPVEDLVVLGSTACLLHRGDACLPLSDDCPHGVSVDECFEAQTTVLFTAAWGDRVTVRATQVQGTKDVWNSKLIILNYMPLPRVNGITVITYLYEPAESAGTVKVARALSEAGFGRRNLTQHLWLPQQYIPKLPTPQAYLVSYAQRPRGARQSS